MPSFKISVTNQSVMIVWKKLCYGVVLVVSFSVYFLDVAVRFQTPAGILTCILYVLGTVGISTALQTSLKHG